MAGKTRPAADCHDLRLARDDAEQGEPREFAAAETADQNRAAGRCERCDLGGGPCATATAESFGVKVGQCFPDFGRAFGLDDLDAERVGAQPPTGRTSRTSGMKCRSKFSIPIFNVIVELGHPAQAPRMVR